jgi:DNA helicase II / ATP-dependent DNA helicase PcrA
MDLLNDLNESQRKAVEYIDGPSLVIAGAGSGKTRVLTYKIAYLLHLKKDLNSLLVLTFTNKAAREMVGRIRKMFGEKFSESQKYMGTFHSVFARILHKKASFLGFSSDFSIYDESDSCSLIKMIVKEMGLDERTYKPKVIHAVISNAKNNLIGPSEYMAEHIDDKTLTGYHSGILLKNVAKIYKTYSERCLKANAMDFDDLLYYTYKLFKNEQICQKYANSFKYILVDEYQDTNKVQQSILSLLFDKMDEKNICAVGDDSQSIYSFRGANIDNILNFQKHFTF